MGAVRTQAIAHLRRRRLQATVIATVLCLASGAATVALDVLVESQAPYDNAFAQANGAHLVIDYDGRLTSDQLAATTKTAGVTGSAGPWPIAEVGFLDRTAGGKGPGIMLSTATVSGRSSPNTSVDAVALTAGRWWQKPGEIVLAQTPSDLFGLSVGDTIEIQQAPPRTGKQSGKQSEARPQSAPSGAAPDLAKRTLTVIGIAGSISTPQTWGWLSPEDLAALTPGQVPSEEILYRVDPSATAAELASATTLITKSLPTDSVVASRTYLAAKANVDRTASIFVPILLAFSVFGLLAAGFIIANVVSGIVLTSYRDIGVMKAVGYTPTQVVAILLVEILVPATIAGLVGVTLGTIASQPILTQTARSFGLPEAVRFSMPVIVAVIAAVLATAFVAAIVPAIRAGRLSVAGAIARGSMPSSTGRPGALLRRANALRVPTPARLGVAAGIAHPVRAAMTLGALVVGVAALVFAVSLNVSLHVVGKDLIRDAASPVRIELAGRSYPPAQVTAAILADTDTGHFVSSAERDVATAGIGPVPFVAYDGDSTWLGYVPIKGRWFSRAGEAVAPTNFFTRTGLRVGDTTTVALNGRTETLTLVGEIFDQAPENEDDLVIRGEWADLLSLDPAVTPDRWEVQPVAGVSPEDYRSGLRDSTNAAANIGVVSDSATNETFMLFDAVITTLGALLIVTSLAGVFDTVLLETRQRTRETAVLKALGMTPRQVVGSVLASVVPVGLLAGIVGVPLGLALQRIVLGFMGQAASGTGVPAQAIDVLPATVLALLGFGGLAIAIVGAWLPAQRAARARIAPVLQAE
jgi:putative ABC transport system permease protein